MRRVLSVPGQLTMPISPLAISSVVYSLTPDEIFKAGRLRPAFS